VPAPRQDRTQFRASKEAERCPAVSTASGTSIAPLRPHTLGDPSMVKEPKNLDDLFHDTLKNIYLAEKKILATLPKMAKAAQSEELKAAFEKHHGETEGQIERLEQVFAIIDAKP
jgi:hypothetical protein